MSILAFVAGVAVGAAFSPFWMSLWDKVKEFAAKNKAQ
jgi:hypothetical protein